MFYNFSCTCNLLVEINNNPKYKLEGCLFVCFLSVSKDLANR